MSMQDQKSTQPRPGSPAPAYEKLCCLFLGWKDATNEKNEQIKELESVLHDKYGAFSEIQNMDHKDLKDTERAFSYVVEAFLKKHDSHENLLVIIYSGSSYVHQGQLFLEPHYNTEPTVQWTDWVDKPILHAAARVLLIFDTTNMRAKHYTQMWQETRKRMDAIRYRERSNVLSILAINGSDTKALTSSLSTAASANPGGFTISQLHEAIYLFQTPQKTPTVELCDISKVDLWEYGTLEVILLPLVRPRLRLHEHHVFSDPHDEYLQNYITIYQDGPCHVIKLSMGPDLQRFSTSSCEVVAVKRFSIRPRTRPHFRNDFLTEKENLFEVAKWNHPHLLGMFATFETKCWCSGFETLNIVLPFARGGNLYEFLRLEQETRWEQREYPTSDPSLIGCLADWRYAVFRETVGLAEAVAALHEDRNGKFILHCDIKPSNILIQRGAFKIADFGLSRLKASDETSKTEWDRGTALYSPPERDLLPGRGRDVWALGCVFLEIAYMIRFAFQDAILGKVGATRQPMYEGLRNIIDMFELDRKKSVSRTGETTAIYHKTIDYVRECMRKFYIMRAGLRRRIVFDGMFPVIRRMLDEDQATRITAAEAAAQLRSNYLSLQDDPQLQEAIWVRDNPGGPPAEPFDREWNRLFGPAEAEAPFNHRVSTNMSGSVVQYDGGPYLPPLSRTVTAPTGSTGQTEKFGGVALDEAKRPASSEENRYHQPLANPRLAHNRALGGTMPSPDAFGSQNHGRSSSMEEDSGNKRRRTDAPF